ncbi:MAG: class I SAM-dependent methyltransferase [Filomicrobium sp.]
MKNTDSKSKCRFCGSTRLTSVVDLGKSPLCESFLTAEQLSEPESFYKLQAFVCEDCFLVQVEEHVSGEQIFGGDYAYFSSFSDSWLAHCRLFAEQVTQRFKLDASSQVIELASNDGYLLQNFVADGIPALGIEPAENVAKAAIEKGVPTLVKFFGVKTAEELSGEGIQADLLCANNVLAHVPDLNDFVAGIKIALKPTGVATIECPHLMRLFEGNQFDTIYQEHYCYFSIHALKNIFGHHGLEMFDIEELETHGGSLRLYLHHTEDNSHKVTENVHRLHNIEIEKGYDTADAYSSFEERVHATKRNFLEFLIDAKRNNKQVAGYGAPGKGNTLLNYCGVRTDFIDYVVDRNPYKHGKYLPGTHIPIYPPEQLAMTKPDYIVIMPWNLKDEIAAQLDYTKSWGAKLVVAIPELTIL